MMDGYVMAVASARVSCPARYVSITRAGNAFTVWATNDPTGAAHHPHYRTCLSQFSRTPGGLGRACALFNRFAAKGAQ